MATKRYRPAMLSLGLGRACVHSFETKVQQAAKHGFEGLEIFYEDLEFVAKALPGNTDPPAPEHLYKAAEKVHDICASLGLEVISLNPFLFYDGLLDREQHSKLLEKAKVWFRIVSLLGTDMIQISANFLPADQLTDDIDVISGDLRELADLGLQAQLPVRFSYEALCFSTHINTWEKAWDVVKRVDRPNFGLVLDSFNLAGGVWADPVSPTGRKPNADEDLRESLERLVREIDVKKVFYLQVIDAERLDRPLTPSHPYHVDGQPPRMSWSRNARAFPYEVERGAYLPTEAVVRAFTKGLGYEGWISLELFSRTVFEKGEHVPEEHAIRAEKSWKTLESRLKLN